MNPPQVENRQLLLQQCLYTNSGPKGKEPTCGSSPSRPRTPLRHPIKLPNSVGKGVTTWQNVRTAGTYSRTHRGVGVATNKRRKNYLTEEKPCSDIPVPGPVLLDRSTLVSTTHRQHRTLPPSTPCPQRRTNLQPNSLFLCGPSPGHRNRTRCLSFRKGDETPYTFLVDPCPPGLPISTYAIQTLRETDTYTTPTQSRLTVHLPTLTRGSLQRRRLCLRQMTLGGRRPILCSFPQTTLDT